MTSETNGKVNDMDEARRPIDLDEAAVTEAARDSYKSDGHLKWRDFKPHLVEEWRAKAHSVITAYLRHAAKPQPTTHADGDMVSLKYKLEEAYLRAAMLTRERDAARAELEIMRQAHKRCCDDLRRCDEERDKLRTRIDGLLAIHDLWDGALLLMREAQNGWHRKTATRKGVSDAKENNTSRSARA